MEIVVSKQDKLLGYAFISVSLCVPSNACYKAYLRIYDDSRRRKLQQYGCSSADRQADQERSPFHGLNFSSFAHFLRYVLLLIPAPYSMQPSLSIFKSCLCVSQAETQQPFYLQRDCQVDHG